MSDAARPFVLECWEMDPDACEMAWRKWSTYQTAENALERRDKLNIKGHQARVMDSTTGAVVNLKPKAAPMCPLCDQRHAGPFDGGCLL